MTTTPERTALVPGKLAACICLANKSPCDLCCGDLCFLDAGIHVVFRPKKNETAVAVAMDGCVFIDSRKKCDGMFILTRPDRIDVLLVELKGSHLDDAYEQIAYVVNHRKEYADAISHLACLAPTQRQVRERSVIVSTGLISRNAQQKLEKAWGIRPSIITVQKPARSAPDLRNIL
jgi:hypothetical protein